MKKYNFHTYTPYSSKLDPIEEANKRYAEKLNVQRIIAEYDSRRLELFKQLDSNTEAALKAFGLDLIKRVCSIDQELAHNILSILSQAVENDNFEDIDMSFKRLIVKKLDEEEKKSHKYR